MKYEEELNKFGLKDENNQYDILSALKDISDYNGHEEEIKELLDYIQKSNEEYSISIPEFLKHNNCDYFVNIIWQILVLLYGDYGTSPRYGWIEIINKDKVISFLQFLIWMEEYK